MVGLVKLVRNGNSIQVTIPRTFLRALEWTPGAHVIIGVNEDRTLTIRELKPEELALRLSSARVPPIPAELVK